MLVDLILHTTHTDQLTSVQWLCPILATAHQKQPILFLGELLSNCIDVSIDTVEGSFVLGGQCFTFQRVNDTEGSYLLLCQKEDVKTILMEETLHRMPIGIQIYDNNGHVVFFNHVSCGISSIPDHLSIAGKHLTELYDLEEEVSTVLTSLRVGAPVRNRLDTFNSYQNAPISTSNSAYPIRLRGDIIGSILFEHDAHSISEEVKNLERIRSLLENHNGTLTGHPFSGYNFSDIFYRSTSMQETISLARRFAAQTANVLLVGETGTGKEMFAQSIHKASSRTAGKFVAINCAAVPETLIESMLFGTKKGAFTGSEERIGLFEEAQEGTLFLDELNSMSAGMQAKLLRVVQEGVFRRVGETRERRVNVRIISSCNEHPEVILREGKFRRDLFYRLSTVQVEIPPLRKRLGDITALATHYVGQKKGRYSKQIHTLHPAFLDALEHYHWPGNVRELYHVLDFALNVMEGDILDLDCLPEYLRRDAKELKSTSALPTNVTQMRLEDIMGDYESDVLKQVLEHHGGNISRAAQTLGLCRQTLSYRIRKYGIIV